MEFNPDEVNRLIHQRRSVFPAEYTGARVDNAIVAQMLENARWAPTHKMTEPWHFVVFTGDGLRKLAEFQAQCYREASMAANNFKADRYDGLLRKPLESSHVVAVGMKRDKKKSVPEIEEVGAVFCAVQNMYLTATAYGIGCYFSTGGITYFEEAKEFFGLLPDDKLLGFLHIGVPKGTSPERRRKALEEKVEWHI